MPSRTSVPAVDVRPAGRLIEQLLPECWPSDCDNTATWVRQVTCPACEFASTTFYCDEHHELLTWAQRVLSTRTCNHCDAEFPSSAIRFRWDRL